MGDGSIIFTTVATEDYLPGALVLFESLRETQENFRFFTLVADESERRHVLPREMNPVPSAVLDQSEFPSKKYDPFELCNALRYPWIEFLLRTENPSYVVYLDSDILVLNSFRHLFSEMKGRSFCLTPHILKPFPLDEGLPNDVTLMTFGTYNSGMLAFESTPAAESILGFLKQRTARYCYNDPPRYFVDQKILPLAVSLFLADFCQLNHPGFNVAYWNLHERKLRMSEGTVLSNGKPLVFVHFSGYEPSSPQQLTRWPSRPLEENGEVVTTLIERYFKHLTLARQQITGN